MHGYGYGYGYGIEFLFWLLPLFFLIILIVMLALFFRRHGMPGITCPMCGHHCHHHGESVSAKEILERRYARGEIGQEEYQKIKQDLESK